VIAKQLGLVAIAMADVSVVWWMVQSSLRNGNIASGAFQTKLVERDASPFTFWSTIALYVVIGVSIFAAALDALLIG